MALLVGLTGGMGSGKSTASRLFGELGAYVLDADALCRELMEPDQPVWRKIVDWLGESVLNPDRTLNRARIADHVFRHPDDRKKLEAILHPKVFELEARRYEAIRQDDPDAVVVIDAALLIESGNYRKVDKVVVVACDEALCLERILAGRPFKKEDVLRRMRTQMPLDEKLTHADHVIDNSGDPAALQTQVETLFRQFQAEAR